jgi:hypothetical protein
MSEHSDELEFKFGCPLCSYNKKKMMKQRRKEEIIKGGNRQTVINVYNYFKNQFPDKSDNYIVKEPAQAERLSTE